MTIKTTDTESVDVLAMLRDSLQRYLDDQHGFEQRLHALAHADDAPPPFWQGLARDLDLPFARPAWLKE